MNLIALKFLNRIRITLFPDPLFIYQSTVNVWGFGLVCLLYYTYVFNMQHRRLFNVN